MHNQPDTQDMTENLVQHLYGRIQDLFDAYMNPVSWILMIILPNTTIQVLNKL